jgi:dCTP deaminase
MILSNCEIHKAIDNGRLVISPEPLPRRPSIHQECPYNTHSVDLKLYNEIRVPEPGKYSIDLMNPGSLTDLIIQHSKKYTLTPKQGYQLAPHEFILARTLEVVKFPIQAKPPHLAARIEGKSSRGRIGLIVHCTAPTVHPGFEGSLTLEIVNLGPAPIIMAPNMYIAQLIVEQVDGEIYANPSQYQNQTDPAG